MLTRLLGTLLLAQALALALLRAVGVLSLPGVAIAFLGIYAGIAAGMFAISEIWRGPRPAGMRIGPLRALRLYLAETLSLLALYVVFHPLARIFGPPAPPPGAQGPPVLFIHGYCCNAGFWWWIRRRLARHGITNTHAITCEPLFTSIDRFAVQVAERVADIRATHGGAPVILVGHSMGGLIARRHVQLHGPAGVARIIALGSPHHGTVHARIGKSRNGRQMRVDSEWLAELNADEHSPAPVPILSAFSYHDNIVAPQESARLDHADNRPFAGLGHLEMAFSPRIVALLRDELAATHP